jgi:hypothetical protein
LRPQRFAKTPIAYPLQISPGDEPSFFERDASIETGIMYGAFMTT